MKRPNLKDARVGMDIVSERGGVSRGAYISSADGVYYMDHAGRWTFGVGSDDNWWANVTEASAFLWARRNPSRKRKEAPQ